MRATVVLVLLAAALAASGVRAAGPAPLGGAVGAYRFADGSTAALVRQGAGLRLVDYRSGALRQLSPRSHDLFVGGPGVSVLQPVRVTVRLVPGRGGASVGLRLGGRSAARLPLVVRAAAFRDGGVRIAGRLLLPAGRGPFPAVVIVPGSPPARRDAYDLWAMFFASHGFAVLSYDKRGVGGSTGRYVRAATDRNLHDLAADALAGVAWLRRQHEIDASRIGLTGGSQAGWIIVLAAATSHDVRFATIQSGPAMSVGRQLAYAGLTRQGAADPPPTDERVHQTLDATTDSGFDPRPSLAVLRIPVLWQLGAVDKRMYTPETVSDLQTIAAAGGHDFTVRVYPGGAHSLRLTAHGLIREEAESPGFVPGLFSDLTAWLAAHVRSR